MHRGVTRTDEELLDAVTDLGRLSTRQLLERLVRGQARMEMSLSAASDYMTAALESLDVQMRDLQTRLQADAANLAEQVRLVQEGQADTAALTAAADRVQATAVLVAGLDTPTAVADENQPEVEAGDVPTDDPATPAEPTDPETPAV